MSDDKRNLMTVFAGTDQMGTRKRFEAMYRTSPTLEMFESVPAWAFVQAASDDRNAPLIRTGEVVIAEPGAFLPTDGDLFVIEYVSKPQVPFEREQRTRQIVLTRHTPVGWWASSLRQGDDGSSIFVSHGPYPDPVVLADKIVGRVVGILATSSVVRRMARK